MKRIILSLSIIMALSLGIGGMCEKKTKPAETLPVQQQEQVQEQTQTQQATPPPTESAEQTYSAKSLKEMMALGKTLKCELIFEDAGDTGDFTMTVYLDGEDIRIDSIVDVPTNGMGKIESHLISDGTWAYSWMNGMKTGIKMDMSEMEQEIEEAEDSEFSPSDTQQIDLQKKYDYKCEKWTRDNSMFFPPANMEFTDFKQEMCKFCDYEATEEEKLECLREIGCE